MKIDRNIVVSGLIAGIVCGAIVYVFTLRGILEQQREHLRVHETTNKIASDQIADLTYQLYQAKMAAEFSSVKDFVAGATDALRRDETYTEIWHNGYDRGVAVEAYARAEEEKAKAYTVNKKTD